MKYLVLLIVVLVVIWAIRHARRDDARNGAPGAARPAAPPGPPQDMVECPVCSVHLPRTDALPGPDGRLYCCAEHRRHGG